jgi:outer membrane receptor protein involved in Fe transport
MEQVKYRSFSSRVFRYTDETLLNEITNNTDKYYGVSNLFSSYILYKGGNEKLKFTTGVRNENQHFMVKTSDFSGQDIFVTKSYYDLLPTINTNYFLTEKNSIRFGLSRTIARPEFREVSNFAFYDFVRNAQIIGNPNLEKTNISNIDFRFERYMSVRENLFVSAFFKHFQNPIEQIVANGSVPSNLILTYSNPKQAINYGVELEYRKSLSKSLSLYTNMSLIKSQVEVNGVVRPLQGQSPYIINTGLYYQHKNISVSFLYNRIGERITAVGFNGYSDIYENSRDLLDATIQYRTNKIEFKLSFTDILSQPTVLYQKTNGDLINTINEKTISISLNYKL